MSPESPPPIPESLDKRLPLPAQPSVDGASPQPPPSTAPSALPVEGVVDSKSENSTGSINSNTNINSDSMPSRRSSCVIGIDVGGTNTDCVILERDQVVAWHKTPTTSNIHDGVEAAIEAVVTKANLTSGSVDSVKIGTTQFVNAILEQDSSKLDKVAVIRLCGPYTQGSPPFTDFPAPLRKLMEGHYAYVDGGYQLDGTDIMPLNHAQLKEQAAIIRSKSLTSIVLIGVYSPSKCQQEEAAQAFLAQELGPGYDISCSYLVGRLGFLERENASILNASLRRFARHVIAGFARATQKLGRCKLYITLNDGTLSRASTATEYPVRCFASGPTNSARGAALLARVNAMDADDEREVLVVDVGGTTTDICALLKNGYPRESAAFVKIAGVRTNFTIPDVHSIALGGGSLIRNRGDRTSVGPDSVGSRLEEEGIAFGGSKLTATDLVMDNDLTQKLVSSEDRTSGLGEVTRMLEEAIDLVKTKQGDARVILVGGGSIVVSDKLAGVGKIVRPDYLEVANAVGAAIAKVSGVVDMTIVPGDKTGDEEIIEAKALAIERCIEAGGDERTIEIVEIDVVPMSYVTNGAYRLVVRVVGDLVEGYEEKHEDTADALLEGVSLQKLEVNTANIPQGPEAMSKGDSYDIMEHVDLEAYKPRIEGDYWYVSEIDLAFLNDGTGILGVGSTGEPYASYLACLLILRNGGDIIIRRQDTFPDDGVVLSSGFMGSPTVYQERVPGVTEVADAMKAVMGMAGLTDFDAVVPNEIGGLNSIESLLSSHRYGKAVLDTDLVARAYPKIWQTVRCLGDIPVTPSAIATGTGIEKLFPTTKSHEECEELMRNACSDLGSLTGMCTNPIYGVEAKTLPKNSFSWAWSIGRSIALARAHKLDPVHALLSSQNGILLFTGKIISVNRWVGSGFTRGNVTLEASSTDPPSSKSPYQAASSSSSSSTSLSSSSKTSQTLFVDFENENLNAILREAGKEDRLLAICPDLITFLDRNNGAPLGASDYKYGLRVSVIALKSPPVWTTEKGLAMGGPRAFGVDMDYQSASMGEYEAPKSVWEMYGHA